LPSKIPIYAEKICDMRSLLKYAKYAASHIRVKPTCLIYLMNLYQASFINVSNFVDMYVTVQHMTHHLILVNVCTQPQLLSSST